MGRIWLLNLITFIAAFLLFQIELIIAKVFLPNYGGSYLVWGACIVFFQAVLFLGYLSSHVLIQKLGIVRYRYVHLVFLLFPLLYFPGRSLVVQHAENQIPLTVHIFLELLISIGPVFFVLSTISLFTQSFLLRSSLPAKDDPYALYAVSNFGSFAALLSYPFIFEMLLDLTQQLSIWRILYFLLILLHLIGFYMIGVKNHSKIFKEKLLPIDPLQTCRWLILGAAGTILFLSVNNIITTEIAPVPLLWIVPLCVYLITFVLNFKKACWCPAWIPQKIHITLGFSALFFFLIVLRIVPILFELILLCAALFILCMFCQNQLIISRPEDNRHLTAFYVFIAFGSFLGGLMTSWVIPLISNHFVEYFIGLIAVAAVLPYREGTEKRTYYIRLVMYLAIFIILWSMIFYKFNVFGVVFIFVVVFIIFSELAKDRHALILSLICVFIITSMSGLVWKNAQSVYRKRNYYGIYEIFDKKNTRGLYHGTTLHGLQVFTELQRREPKLYYSRESPIGEIMTSNQFQFQRVGIIGLGAGTLAAYSKPGQVYDIYELDDDVYQIAERFFTYLKDAKGEINHIFGDARISLERNKDVKYDLLIVDAFGGDSIPFHLLTKEAIALYKARLTQRGILSFHITNRYIGLGPVLKRNAELLNAHWSHKEIIDTSVHGASTHWVAMTWDAEYFKTFISVLRWRESEKETAEKIRPWTDTYSNILPVLQFDRLFEIN